MLDYVVLYTQSTAEIIWKGKEEPLIFLDSLKEAHLFFLEGMTNGMLLLVQAFNLFTLTVHLRKMTLVNTWRQRMLRRNIQSCTPDGGRILQISRSMAYTQFGSYGEQQEKLGRKSCLLQYEPFNLSNSLLLVSWTFILFSTFFVPGRKYVGRYSQIYFARTHLHRARSSSWEASWTFPMATVWSLMYTWIGKIRWKYYELLHNITQLTRLQTFLFSSFFLK